MAKRPSLAAGEMPGQQYQRGDTILKSAPFAFVIIQSQRAAVCESCWGSVGQGEGLPCQACRLVCYCSPLCKEKGEGDHAAECQALAQAGTAAVILPDQLRLVIRIWLKVRNAEEGSLEETGYGLEKNWDSLMDHAQELREDSMDLLKIGYQQLVSVLRREDLPSLDTYISIYGKILINSFSLRTDRSAQPDPFGTGIYLLASIFDHSCVPNCTVVFQGRELRVVATQDLPEGEVARVAFISYVNSMDNTRTRSTQHRVIWYFSCHCSLCQETELDLLKHSMQCAKCGEARALDVETWSAPGPCSDCGYRAEKEDSKQVQRYKQLRHVLTEEGKSDMSHDELAEWGLGEMEDIFSHRDILYLQTCHYAHTVCMAGQRWQAAVQYGETVLPWFKKYYGPQAGVVAGLLARLGEAQAEQGDQDKAEEYLKEAAQLFRVVPGEKHPYYQEDFLPLYMKHVAE